MKIIKLASVLLCSSLILAGCATSNDVVLKINDRKITKKEFNKHLLVGKKAYAKESRRTHELPPASTAQLKKVIAHNLIQGTLFEQEIEKRNITVSEEEIKQERAKTIKKLGSEEAYLESLKKNNVDNEQEKRNLAHSVRLNKLVQVVVKPKVTDVEIKKYYKDHESSYYEPEKVRFSQILLKTNYASVKKELIEEDKKMKLSADELDKLAREISSKNEATLKEVLKKVNTRNFANMAMIYSQDKKSASKGGDMGFVKAGDILNTIYLEIRTRKVGEIGPVIESPEGSHIVYVKDRSASMFAPLEVVRADIEAKLMADKENESIKKLMDGLVANADIEINDRTLKLDYINPIEAFFNKFKKENKR